MLLYNINYYYNNIYIRAQVYNNVEIHDDCKTPKRQNDKRQKRHLFVYIDQRTLLKIFKRVRDEARKIF